eukprot:6818480-Alexandrium_andersonii.AAC.1
MAETCGMGTAVPRTSACGPCGAAASACLAVPASALASRSALRAELRHAEEGERASAPACAPMSACACCPHTTSSAASSCGPPASSALSLSSPSPGARARA